MSTPPDYFSYWGKAQSDVPQSAPYHLLSWHSLDVAAVAWHLFDPDRDLMRDLSTYLAVEAVQLRHIIVALAALHDMGKFASAFQALYLDRSTYPALSQHQSRKSYNGSSFRHDMLGWAFLDEAITHGKLAIEGDRKTRRGYKRQLAEMLCCAFGHHGQPIPQKERSLYRDYYVDEDQVAAQQWINAVWSLFSPQISQEQLTDAEWQQRWRHSSWHLAGAMMLADWIGSDTDYFPYDDSHRDIPDYWAEAQHKAAHALSNQGILQQSQVAPFTGLQSLFPFIQQPTPLQQWAEQVEITSEPQLFILEDITGAGKTEAALALAHRLMAANQANGLYFGLPTMATSNVMFDRLVACYTRWYQDESHPSILLAHSANKMHDAFTQLFDHSDDAGHPYATADLDVRAQCNRWLADSRKKALLAEVGVGTIDQALMTVLPVRHQPLRMYGLYRKVLIYDELHSADTYMLTLLKSLLQIHKHQGGSAILITATLSQEKRRQLLTLWGDKTVPFSSMSHAFPLATRMEMNGSLEQTALHHQKPTVDRDDHAHEANVTRVAVHFLHEMAEIVAKIQAWVEVGRCVVWVRNTVDDAREAYEHLLALGIGKPLLFHSRFTLQNRQAKEAQVMETLGKRSAATERTGQILIATQVFQESLDADADEMVTDLCPIDYLLQRAGRLRRHQRDASGNRLLSATAKDQRGQTTLTIYAPAWADAPDSDWYKRQFPRADYVYDNTGQLWLTQQILQERGYYTLPDDARLLIEHVYSQEAAAVLSEGLFMKVQHQGERDKYAVNLANRQLIDFSRGYTVNAAEAWREDTSEHLVGTRQIEVESTSVLVVKQSQDKLMPLHEHPRFAAELSIVNIPGYLVQKADTADDEATSDSKRSTLTLIADHTPAAQALRERYPHISYAVIWLPEADTNYTYDAERGLTHRIKD